MECSDSVENGIASLVNESKNADATLKESCLKHFCMEDHLQILQLK